MKYFLSGPQEIVVSWHVESSHSEQVNEYRLAGIKVQAMLTGSKEYNEWWSLNLHLLVSRTYLKCYNNQIISLLRANQSGHYVNEELMGFLFKNKGEVFKITCKLYNEAVGKILYRIHLKYYFEGFWQSNALF